MSDSATAVTRSPLLSAEAITSRTPRMLSIVRAVLLCAGLFLILIVGREFGVADNGDFTRYVQSYLVKPAGHDVNWPSRESDKAWHDRFFEHPQMYWDIGDHPESPTWSTSANVFWRTGRLLNELFYSSSTLNVKYVGLCFFLLQAFAFAVAMRSMRGKTAMVITAMLVVFVALTCATLLAFYNSFYAESVPLLAMLTVVTYFCTRLLDDPAQPARWSTSILGAVALGLLVLSIFSKRQYLYFVFPTLLLVYYLLFSIRNGNRRVKNVAFIGSGLLLAALTVGWTYANRVNSDSEGEMARITSYHALYYGLLPQSRDQEALLGKLGLPSSSINQIGKWAWADDTLQFIRDTPQINVKTYLKAIYLEPLAFVRSALFNARQIGNFDIDLGMVPGAHSQHPRTSLSLLTRVSTKLSGLALFFAAILFAVVMILFRCGLTEDQFRANRALAMMLLVILGCDVLISTFDGQQESRKHLLLGSLAAILIVSQMLITVSGLGRQRRPAS